MTREFCAHTPVGKTMACDCGSAFRCQHYPEAAKALRDQADANRPTPDPMALARDALEALRRDLSRADKALSSATVDGRNAACWINDARFEADNIDTALAALSAPVQGPVDLSAIRHPGDGDLPALSLLQMLQALSGDPAPERDELSEDTLRLMLADYRGHAAAFLKALAAPEPPAPVATSLQEAQTTPAPSVDAEAIERAAKAFAEAAGYYVAWHRGLSSASADKIRTGIAAALKAAYPVPSSPASTHQEI